MIVTLLQHEQHYSRKFVGNSKSVDSTGSSRSDSVGSSKKTVGDNPRNIADAVLYKRAWKCNLPCKLLFGVFLLFLLAIIIQTSLFAVIFNSKWKFKKSGSKFSKKNHSELK